MTNRYINNNYINSLSLPQQRLLLADLSNRLIKNGVNDIQQFNPYQVNGFQFGRYGQDIQPLLIDYANRLINGG